MTSFTIDRNVKRYSPTIRPAPRPFAPTLTMAPDMNGEFVSYKDYIKLLDQLEQLEQLEHDRNIKPFIDPNTNWTC